MLPTIGKEAVKGELIDATALSVSRRSRAEIRAHLVLAGARVADPIARRGQAGAGFGVPDRRGRNAAGARADAGRVAMPCRSEEHTSELQSLMRISYAVFCLQKKNTPTSPNPPNPPPPSTSKP